MALLNYQQIDVVGTAKTYGAATAGGDTVLPNDRGFLHFQTGATAVSVTIVVPGTEYGQARPDITVALGTSTNRMFGPLPADLADPTTGLINITYSVTPTSVTVAAVQI